MCLHVSLEQCSHLDLCFILSWTSTTILSKGLFGHALIIITLSNHFSSATGLIQQFILVTCGKTSLFGLVSSSEIDRQ